MGYPVLKNVWGQSVLLGQQEMRSWGDLREGFLSGKWSTDPAETTMSAGPSHLTEALCMPSPQSDNTRRY